MGDVTRAARLPFVGTTLAAYHALTMSTLTNSLSSVAPSTEQPEATVHPDKETTGPARFDVPVVVVIWKGRPHLVDGRRRVNHWVAVRSSELHPVLIVEPASPPACSV